MIVTINKRQVCQGSVELHADRNQKSLLDTFAFYDKVYVWRDKNCFILLTDNVVGNKSKQKHCHYWKNIKSLMAQKLFDDRRVKIQVILIWKNWVLEKEKKLKSSEKN